MALKFNPSTTKETNYLLELLSNYALNDWKQQQELEQYKKKLGIQRTMGMENLSRLKGLFPGTEQPSGAVSPFAKQPISPYEMGKIDLETGMPQVGIRSPEDMRGLQFQQDVGRFKAAGQEYGLGAGMTKEKFTLMPREQRAEFIKSRMANFPGARGAMQELRPQFITPAGERQFTQNEKGLWTELKPTQRDITNPEGLTSGQQIQARALAKKIYGVRGAQFGLPAVFEEMRKGKSIDEIEDTLRYSGQSKEFSGDIRNAAQTILINSPEDKSQKAMDYIDDLLSKGDMSGVKNQLKRLARTQAGQEEQRSVIGKERTIKLLDEIQDDLNNLERMGTNTNIFTGTAEDIAAKVGTVKNPEARKVATKISTAVQNYRRSMTGVQFGMPENKEYQLMFPKISRTANFNTANINALKEVMSGDLDNFYSLYMGENEYQKLFKSQQQISSKPSMFNPSQTQPTKDQFQVGQTIIKGGKTYKYNGNGQWSY